MVYLESPINDPISVPVDWHRFLYRSILLPWEVNKRAKFITPRFSQRRLIAGLTLIKKDSVREVTDAWKLVGLNGQIRDQLTFYSRDAALVDLVEHLRNCVAHGDYSQTNRDRIFFWHKFQGKLKFFGDVRFSSLKELIAYSGI